MKKYPIIIITAIAILLPIIWLRNGLAIAYAESGFLFFLNSPQRALGVTSFTWWDKFSFGVDNIRALPLNSFFLLTSMLEFIGLSSLARQYLIFAVILFLSGLSMYYLILELFDKKIKNSDDRNGLKSQIGYVSQHFALYDDMTVRENMMFFASIHKIDAKKSTQLIDNYSKELGFEQYLDEIPKSLPLGINQRFSLAVSILHEPKVLFLDEPTSGVDAIARAQFWELLKELKNKRDISILITTHYMSEAEFCDRVVLLKDGEKIADDKVENFYKKFPNAKSFEEIFLEYYR